MIRYQTKFKPCGIVFRKNFHTLGSCIFPVELRWTDGSLMSCMHFPIISEKGYAAAVYLRCANNSTVNFHLIFAKSKVSPLKRVSIPRLELCDALLSAKLVHHTQELLKSSSTITALSAWTDSTTTLAWIQSYPHR